MIASNDILLTTPVNNDTAAINQGEEAPIGLQQDGESTEGVESSPRFESILENELLGNSVKEQDPDSITGQAVVEEVITLDPDVSSVVPGLEISSNNHATPVDSPLDLAAGVINQVLDGALPEVETELAVAVAPSPTITMATTATLAELNKRITINSTNLITQTPKTGSSTASSLAALSDDGLKDSQKFPIFEGPTNFDSDNKQMSGNHIPPIGKSLPGSLPFFDPLAEKSFKLTGFDDFSKLIASQSQVAAVADSPINNAASGAKSDSPSATVAPQAGITSPLDPALNSTAGDKPTALSINAMAGSSDWNNQLGDKIRWMGRVNISSAELKLNPAELGSVEIKIVTEDEQTRVSIITANSSAKEIIENSLPKLRELLANSGLQLEQSDVSEKNLAEKEASQESEQTRLYANKDSDNSDETVIEEGILHRRQNTLNQIDHYV